MVDILDVVERADVMLRWSFHRDSSDVAGQARRSAVPGLVLRHGLGAGLAVVEPALGSGEAQWLIGQGGSRCALVADGEVLLSGPLGRLCRVMVALAGAGLDWSVAATLRGSVAHVAAFERAIAAADRMDAELAGGAL